MQRRVLKIVDSWNPYTLKPCRYVVSVDLDSNLNVLNSPGTVIAESRDVSVVVSHIHVILVGDMDTSVSSEVKFAVSNFLQKLFGKSLLNIIYYVKLNGDKVIHVEVSQKLSVVETDSLEAEVLHVKAILAFVKRGLLRTYIDLIKSIS